MAHPDEKNEIKRMLSVAMVEPALITPVERRLNHQILKEATKQEEARFRVKRRNSDPPEIVNIHDAHGIRLKKKHD